MRVAVLEDDIAQLELLSHWLKLAGHSAHGYQLGEVLLRELVRESFNVLVLDWPKRRLSPRWAASATRTTTPWRKRLSDSTRPK